MSMSYTFIFSYTNTKISFPIPITCTKKHASPRGKCFFRSKNQEIQKIILICFPEAQNRPFFVTLTVFSSFTKALFLYYDFIGDGGMRAIRRLSAADLFYLYTGDSYMIWILLTLVYGLLKGGREISKKKAMDRNSVMEVLLLYTFLGFLIVIPRAPHAMGLLPYQYGLILLKSFSIFVAWMMGFHALKHLPVSLYGVLDLSRVLMGTLLGVFIFHEILVWNQFLGLGLVVLGLLALKLHPSKHFFRKKAAAASAETAAKSEKTSGNTGNGGNTADSSSIPPKFVLLAFGSCVLNSVSALLDKILMKKINSSQMQFWYMLFLLLFYVLYVVITHTKIHKSAWKNIYIWLMAIMFVIGDASLFIANADPGSLLTVMTVVKQSACFVTILGGKIVFHEENIGYRLFCAFIIFCGIILCTFAR